MSDRDLVGLVERDKTASEKLITLSWEDSEWFEVLQIIGKEVAQLEALKRASQELIDEIGCLGGPEIIQPALQRVRALLTEQEQPDET